MTDFTNQLWQGSADIIAAIHAHPFNTGLAAGTLARAPFEQYVIQDALYLEAYGRALAIAAARAPEAEAIIRFAGAAREAIEVERALHGSFFEKLGIDPAIAASTDKSPACQAYTDFLLATAQIADYPTLIAAILPCFWIYWDVGCRIAETAAPDNPYQPWIDTYSDESFGAATRAVIALVDEAANGASGATRTAMSHAFKRCAQYEYMFWDSAWRQEAWPV